VPDVSQPDAGEPDKGSSASSTTPANETRSALGETEKTASVLDGRGKEEEGNGIF